MIKQVCHDNTGLTLNFNATALGKTTIPCPVVKERKEIDGNEVVILSWDGDDSSEQIYDYQDLMLDKPEKSVDLDPVSCNTRKNLGSKNCSRTKGNCVLYTVLSLIAHTLQA